MTPQGGIHHTLTHLQGQATILSKQYIDELHFEGDGEALSTMTVRRCRLLRTNQALQVWDDASRPAPFTALTESPGSALNKEWEIAERKKLEVVPTADVCHVGSTKCRIGA